MKMEKNLSHVLASDRYSPNYMYDKETYPNYLSGTGYVMSIDVALRIYNVSLKTPLFHLEDVYVTGKSFVETINAGHWKLIIFFLGICALAAKVKPQNHPLFNFSRYKYLCEIRGTITTHQLTPSGMKRAYDFVRNAYEICHVPYAKRRLTPVKKVNHCS